MYIHSENLNNTYGGDGGNSRQLDGGLGFVFKFGDLVETPVGDWSCTGALASKIAEALRSSKFRVFKFGNLIAQVWCPQRTARSPSKWKNVRSQRGTTNTIVAVEATWQWLGSSGRPRAHNRDVCFA